MNASSPSTARELLKLQEVQPGRICLNCPATTLQPGPPGGQDGLHSLTQWRAEWPVLSLQVEVGVVRQGSQSLGVFTGRPHQGSHDVLICRVDRHSPVAGVLPHPRAARP